jgi:hypothetical protein
VSGPYLKRRWSIFSASIFALAALYEALERRGVRYAIRLQANDVLERRIEDLLTRPPRPTEPCAAGPVSELRVSGGLVGSAATPDR